MSQSLVEFYESFRPAIFSTSLTLGTFLFTMKTFVIQTMKRDVFDHAVYKKEVAQRIREGKKNEKLYGSLHNFKNVYVGAIIAAILNAFVQITVGAQDATWAIKVCFATTALSWAIVIWCLCLVSVNLRSMLDFGEAVFRQEIEDAKPPKDDVPAPSR